MQYKPLETLELVDLLALQGVAAERKRREYKRDLPSAKGDDVKEFANDVSSFANTNGGDILYGVEEDRETHTPRHIGGVAAADSESQIERLHNILRDGIRPRLQVEMESIKVSYDRVVLVVRIPESHLAPHQVTLNHRFYARNTNGKYVLEVSELRDMILRKASLPERMREFRRSRIDLFGTRPQDLPSPIDYERKLIVHFMPEETFARPDAVDVAQIAVNPSLRNSIATLGSPIQAAVGLSFRSNIDGYLFMNGLSSDRFQFYVQVFYDGTIEFVDGTAFMTTTTEPVIYHLALEHNLFRAFSFARRIFQALNIEGRVAIFASALGVRNLTIKPQAPLRMLELVGHSTAIGRDPALFNALLIESMLADPETALEPLVSQFWRACAFDRAYSYKDGSYVGSSW